MKVIEYLKEFGTQKLNEEYGVIVKSYEEGLYVLNYDQINSPKNDITTECRGLILDHDFNIVSRSFDRFFNYGENFATFNPQTAVAYEKIDGSLIKIYNWKGIWYVSTRGTAFAESGVNGWGITFKEMVFKSLDVSSEAEFQDKCEGWLDCSRTYIFEVTGVENRVVTRYSGYTLWFLASRNNLSGRYYSYESTNVMGAFGAKTPKQFKFDSIEACLETAKHLPDLQEGYVMYENGIPVCKVKSPAYVAIHFIKGNGLNPKRIATLVLLNEQDEYLKYFPEDTVHFEEYIFAHRDLVLNIGLDEQLTSHIVAQKEFAIAVKDKCYSAVLFSARKSKTSAENQFNKMEINFKLKMLERYMGGNWTEV